MDYIKIRFTRDFERTGSNFDRTIGETFRSLNPVFTLSERLWKPQMDIYETGDEIIVLAEIAGVNKEDLEVEISSKAVKISGERAVAQRVDGAVYRLAEIQYGRFERLLFLPALIDPETVSASYLNGMLQIRLSKISMNKIQKITISDE
ncbi:MAG: Hsp20/alpha crystallin family protein [Deltaproteobacteria bacterium]|nr:Hsp20/alpha crystallin family protein [Deltaproteobacteria bacterium]